MGPNAGYNSYSSGRPASLRLEADHALRSVDASNRLSVDTDINLGHQRKSRVT